jgi:hypothetical protein
MLSNLNLLSVVIGIYLIVAHVYTFYFWYLWAQDSSFLSTIFVAPFICEIKGLLFPFFI